LGRLAEMFDSARVVPAAVSFVDIAGLVRGASEGQGLGNRFLANIREADAVCQVVRVFSDPDVVHVGGGVDPASDIATVNTELILADLATVDARLPKLAKEARVDAAKQPLLAAVQAAREVLDSGRTLSSEPSVDVAALRELFLLTAKPFLYVFNVDEDALADDARRKELADLVAPADAIVLCAKVEAELTELPEDDAAELLASLGQTESGLTQLARIGFHTLGLQTYLTAGPKEARAWTIKIGATAPEAAGVIHTDFQRGFIKAEIVSYDDLMAAGSMAAARAAGKVRVEGKDYVMADGDVVEFRFNV
jgi:GTP-binding protein YchF